MTFPLNTFLRLLQSPSTPSTFNPWRDHDPSTDLHPDAPKQRLQRLQSHLHAGAEYLLIGEAAGYQGCKVTGIPFTSERLILEHAIPRTTANHARLSTRPRPWSEPSATTVWKTLHQLGIPEQSIPWNAYPWHPHKPGNPHSNRTPTPAERSTGLPILQSLLRLYPAAHIFAVGRNAERSLQDLNAPFTPLRHPSMGGATRFSQQLRAALR
jgi:uracil-DNA glycosylase